MSRPPYPITTAGGALRRLAYQGRNSPLWRPGMRVLLDKGPHGGVIALRRSDDGERWVFASDAEAPNKIVDRDAEPDITDPATLGCLKAQLRQATLGGGVVVNEDLRGWHVSVWTGRKSRGVVTAPTEGEAIVAALVWLVSRP